MFVTLIRFEFSFLQVIENKGKIYGVHEIHFFFSDRFGLARFIAYGFSHDRIQDEVVGVDFSLAAYTVEFLPQRLVVHSGLQASA